MLLVFAVNQILASEAFISGTRQIRKDQTRRLQLIEDMKAGSVHTLIMSVNPVYTLADTALLKV
jgi:acid stress-induced BolA-like protein IbaG/YrbA